LTPAAVLRIARIALNVADLDAACAFYTGALGFRRDTAGSADAAVLRLGEQILELRLASGRPYPEPCEANDHGFQHFAIAVSDMDRAYRRLSQYAQQPISRGGPQLLPPSTGSVTAYKFRDPEGHPLELSYIPGSPWLAQARGDEPCLGIDHSALAVADLDASKAFYRDVLGFLPMGDGLNHGPEQDRLDGLDGVKLDIASLQPADGGPHFELLHYRSPRPSPASAPLAPDDIAATRLILQVMEPQGVRRLQDPDGHWLELTDR
jgi:catechol 2,3-dioxygenase-like lactoylglutathione lyase family enzyme